MEVKVIDVMGTDLTVVNAARVSFKKEHIKFDYEKDLVRLNMDKEPKIKKIISKYK